MRKQFTMAGRLTALALTTALLLAACGSSGSGSSKDASGSTTTAGAKNDKVGNVRGFDGTTIKVAAIGIKPQLPGFEWGIKARAKRFNDTNEIPGVKINFTEYADDKADPASTLSEVRRLVTAEKVFSLFSVSATNPGDYLKQQQVPTFGFGFDDSYCSDAPDPSIWSFGFDGCLVPKAPKVEGDLGGRLFEYATKATGKAHPTLAAFSSDSQSGRDSTSHQSIAYTGAGFKVVFAKGNVPLPPVSDYTPYVQQLLKSDSGHAPDVILCLLQADCIPMYTQLRAAGFKGEFAHSLYADIIAKPMEGSVANAVYGSLSEASPERDQMKGDVTAVKADQALETGSVVGYFATDMFIQALKTAAKGGKAGITPENVRKAAASQTWKFGKLAGPTKYPDSTVTPTPTCSAILKSDGKLFQTVIPYTCSDKRYKVTG